MNNSQFDKNIKELLNEISSIREKNWTAMSKKIEEWEKSDPLINDSEFDKVIAEKLSSNTTKLRNRSWERFESLLNQKFIPLRELVLYQVSGAVILILLLLLLYQLGPFQKSDSIITAKELIAGEKVEPDNTQAGIENANHDNHQKPAVETAKALGIDKEEFLRSRQKSTFESESSKRKAENDNNLSAAFNNSEQDVNQNYASNIGVATEEKSYIIGMSEVIRDLVPNRKFVPHKIFVKDSNINSTSYIHSEDQLSNKLSVNSALGRNKDHWQLGFYIIPQMVYVHSPFDEVLREAGYNRWLTNLGLGSSIQYRISSIVISTGIEYQSITYKPRFFEEYVAIEEAYVHIKDIRFSMINVPVNIKYDILKKDALKIYGVGGSSLGFIIKSDYSIEKRNNGLTSLINDLKTNPNYKNVSIAQKQYDPGLMTGGMASKNLLVTMDLGIGVEYSFHKNWTGFFEPALHLNLLRNNYGPNNDQIQRISMKTGVRLSF